MEYLVDSDSALKRTDIEFCNLYFKAISKMLNISDPYNAEAFRRYMELLRTETNANCEFFENPDEPDSTLVTLLTDNLFYRLTYIYRNSAVFSSAVAFHFQNVLEEYPSILEELLQKQKVRICSLGGGPASDVVAIVRVLECAAMGKAVDLDIEVTVVDVNANWRNTCFGVLRCMPRFSSATGKIKFVQADLSQFFTSDTMEVIRQADVVSLVKFSSEFVGGYLNCRDTINEISAIIQPNTLLFILDRPNIHTLRTCGGNYGDLPNFNLIYEEIYDIHTLHLAAVEKNYHMYSKHFGSIVSNTCFKVFARAWMRSASDGEINLLRNRFWMKRVKFDALQFFREQPYKVWCQRLCKEMAKIGWNTTGIEVYRKSYEKMWNGLEAKLMDNLKSVDVTQDELIASMHGQSERIDDLAFKRYLLSKKNLGLAIRELYCEIVITLRGYLKNLAKEKYKPYGFRN